MATVPGNSLQSQLLHLVKNQKKPSYGTQNKAYGVLLDVFNADTLANDSTVGEEILQGVIKAPGRLYGRLQLKTGGTLCLPFKDSPELIYSVYGDAEQLKGRQVEITYYDHCISRGEMKLLPPANTALADTAKSTAIFDIGGIL